MKYVILVLVEVNTEGYCEMVWMLHSGVRHKKLAKAEKELKVARKHFVSKIVEVE